MEIDPRQPAGSRWYIRSGSLVRDMVKGLIQTGEADEFSSINRLGVAFPAQIPVIGDPIITDSTPTYATFTDYATLHNDNRRDNLQGQFVTKLINREAYSVQINVDDPLAKIDYYETATGHNVPAAFTQFMGSQAEIKDKDGATITGDLFDPIWHFGYPITEAYWARVKVNGQEKLIMFQLFERRVLSYTPSNPSGWKVEMGNVGAHYLTWRNSPYLTFSGPPRITKGKFREVLQAYGSPVTGQAESLYDVITSYDLDPAIALAFFIRESGAGTAVGYCDGQNSLNNLNWGNARGDGNGACGFQRFPSWKAGLEYWCKIMSRDYVNRGLDRMEKAIPVYAPSSDGNNVSEYLDNMYRLVYRWQGYKV